MISIDTILDQFLQEQSKRLKQRTLRDYEDVISLFQDYLNHYAYQFLRDNEREKFEEQFDEDNDCFTKMFDHDKLEPSVISEFLDYFIIRKVMSGEEFMKIAVRVMKKLTKWLYESDYVDQDTYNEFIDYFEDAKDLPNVEKLAELIFHHSKKSLKKNIKIFWKGTFPLEILNRDSWYFLESGNVYPY